MQRYTTFVLISILLSFIHAEVQVTYLTNNCFSSKINDFKALMMNIDESITKGIKATFSKDSSKLTVDCGDRNETFMYQCQSKIVGEGAEEGIYSLTQVEGATAEGETKILTLQDIKEPLCYSEMCPNQDISLIHVNFDSPSQRTIRLGVNAKIPSDLPIKVYAGDLEKWSEFPYCRKYSSTVLICLVREEDTQYKMGTGDLYLRVEVCPGIRTQLNTILHVEGKIPEGEAPTDYESWMKIPPIDESGIEVKYTSSNNCYSTSTSSLDSTISNIPSVFKNKVSAIFESSDNKLTVECGTDANEPMKCSNKFVGDAKEGSYWLTELKTSTQSGTVEYLPLKDIKEPFCMSDMCSAMVESTQNVNFADKEQRTIMVNFTSKIPNTTTSYKVSLGNADKMKEIPYCRKYSSKAVICLLREIDTEFKVDGKLLVQYEVCAGVKTKMPTQITVEGKIPEGEEPTDYDAWMKIPPIEDGSSLLRYSGLLLLLFIGVLM